MVDKTRRPTPAPDPAGYSRFSDWLEDAVRAPAGLRGWKAMLGKYVGSDHPNQTVDKWMNTSVPEFHTLRQIAEWGGVDYASLEKIAVAQKEAKEAERREKPQDAKVVPVKGSRRGKANVRRIA